MLDPTPANRYWRLPRYWACFAAPAYGEAHTYHRTSGGTPLSSDLLDINALLMNLYASRRGGYLSFRPVYVSR